MSDVTDFPEKLQCLFEPKRYKVLYGGRGAGRSWGCARASLIKGTISKETILCVREFQNSIKDSVHKLLKEQIYELGMGDFYDVQEHRIIGANGSNYAFEGIRGNTSRIKSYEGISICWAEEAQNISEQSWLDLTPTIRSPGSEIWISFNPQLETDYTYKRFVMSTDELYLNQAFIVKMTYKDNPWFPESLKQDMLSMKASDYDKYLNVWEGYCLRVLTGSIYAKQLRMAYGDERICRVPWVPDVPVCSFWDLGRADKTAIWIAQKVAGQIRIIDYLEATGEDLPYFAKKLKEMPYVFEGHYLPHDGGHKRLGIVKGSLAKFLQSLVGPNQHVSVVPRIAQVEDGINIVRMMFPLCWIDEKKCHLGLEALKNYKYEVDDNNQYSNRPLHDWASDASDAFRTMAMVYVKDRRGTAQRQQSAFFASATSAANELKEKFRELTGRPMDWMGH